MFKIFGTAAFLGGTGLGWGVGRGRGISYNLTTGVG